MRFVKRMGSYWSTWEDASEGTTTDPHMRVVKRMGANWSIWEDNDERSSLERHDLLSHPGGLIEDVRLPRVLRQTCTCVSDPDAPYSNGVDVHPRIGCRDFASDGTPYCYVVSPCSGALASSAYPGRITCSTASGPLRPRRLHQRWAHARTPTSRFQWHHTAANNVQAWNSLVTEVPPREPEMALWWSSSTMVSSSPIRTSLPMRTSPSASVGMRMATSLVTEVPMRIPHTARRVPASSRRCPTTASVDAAWRTRRPLCPRRSCPVRRCMRPPERMPSCATWT